MLFLVVILYVVSLVLEVFELLLVLYRLVGVLFRSMILFYWLIFVLLLIRFCIEVNVIGVFVVLLVLIIEL